MVVEIVRGNELPVAPRFAYSGVSEPDRRRFAERDIDPIVDAASKAQ